MRLADEFLVKEINRLKKKKERLKPQKLSDREEIVNAATHGVGAILAVIGLVVLIIVSGGSIGTAIYGSSLVLLYVISTLYHALRKERAKTIFRRLDHMAIFLLIAGTYTPFCLSVLEGWQRWSILAAVWTCAGGGVALKWFYTGRLEWISLVLYVVLGWMVLVVIGPFYNALSTFAFAFLVLGGVTYTAGTIFYLSERRYSHGIWHLWVLAGSAFHFFSILTIVWK